MNGHSPAKKKILVYSVQLSNVIEQLPQYAHHEKVSMNHFIKLVFRRRFKLFRKFDEIILFSYKNEKLNRPFIWSCLLLLTSRRSAWVDLDHNIRKNGLGNLLKSLFVFSLESALVVPVLVYSKRVLKQTPLWRSKVFPEQATRNILYLNTDATINIMSGGSRNHISEVIENFRKFNFRPTYLAFDRHQSLEQDIEQQIVYTNFFRNWTEIRQLFYNYVLKRHLKRLAFALKPAFIYERYAPNSYIGGWIAKNHNIPYILEYNGSGVWMSKNWGLGSVFLKLTLQIEDWLLQKADLIVVVSKAMEAELLDRKVSRSKILVNPNGVNPDKYAPIHTHANPIRKKYGLEDKVVIGFISTFGPWHGAVHLAQVIAAFKEKPALQDIHFLLIGDGDERFETEAIIQKAGMQQYCTFTGMVPQEKGAAYLGACDIYLSPHVPNRDGTPFFGSPTKLFEYMAMGRAIIASDLDQIGDVLDHNKTALLVEPYNTVQWIEAIERLVRDSKLRASLGSNAREQAVGRHSWKRHVSNIVNKFKQLSHFGE